MASLIGKDSVPVHFVRYEDLFLQPRECYEGILKFFLDQDDLTGTNAERRITRLLEMGSSGVATYKMKHGSGTRLNLNAHRFSHE